MSETPPPNKSDNAAEYSARILTSINQVNAKDWDAHIPSGTHPFLSHAFFKACEDSGSATAETGWTPVHIWLEDESGTAQFCVAQGFSGAHMTFLGDEDRAAADSAGWLHREDRQFHFINRGYDSFEGFLDSLASRKRKNIRKERKAAQDGVKISRLSGDDLKTEHWDIFYRCYIDTSRRKWGRPYLTRAFFDQIHGSMADQIVLVIAEMDETPIAAALNFIGSDALYGRNWGALTHKPFLHFELCYYQAIETGIEHGLPKVEAGAQGEHKLARGYEPIATHSAHYLSHPGLHDAVGNYLEHERLAVERDIRYLGKHTPFKKEN